MEGVVNKGCLNVALALGGSAESRVPCMDACTHGLRRLVDVYAVCEEVIYPKPSHLGLG